jgi:diaminopimelate decarboxylase
VDELAAAGALLDASSPRQIREIGARPSGLRLRVPMPESLESPTSRGRLSRFGVLMSPNALSELRDARAEIRRLRVHTGESTSRTLCFRAEFALAAAELIGGVDAVNLGGGFLRLARRPECLNAALALLGKVIADTTVRRFTVEPGGALVLDAAYLVTEVIDAEQHPARGRTVVVDASAWNVGPWSKTTFHPLADRPDTAATVVVGPSLYEQDFFTHQSTGDARHSFRLGRCRPGDRLVGTSFGAYTLTNGRSFNGLPLPAQYAVDDGGLRPLAGPLAFAEQGREP